MIGDYFKMIIKRYNDVMPGEKNIILSRSSKDRREYGKNRNRHLLYILTALLLIIFTVLSINSFNSNADSRQSSNLCKKFVSVKIEKGDTLLSLSSKYMCSEKNTSEKFISEVLFINNMEDENDLKAGCYIIIPYYDFIS